MTRPRQAFTCRVHARRRTHEPASSLCARRPLHGFTLVELLVVISVIALLVAMLLPVLSSARETARRIICAGHFRQIMIAQVNYGNDNGYFPVMPGDTGGIGTGWQNLSISIYNPLYMAFARNYLDPGIDNVAPNSVVFCPSNTMRGHTLSDGFQYQSALGSSFGSSNGNGYFDTPIWMRIDKGNIVPGGGAICYDGVGTALNAFGAPSGVYYIMNNHGYTSTGLTLGGNVAFYDGHVMWENETHWSVIFAYEGTTYPNDHPAVRVWGSLDKFGFGPPNAALWGSGGFQPFFN